MIKYYLILIGCMQIVANSALAQLNQLWVADYQHTTSSSYSNEGKRTIMDPAGNVYTISEVTSDIDPNGVVTGSTFHYTVLLKYDPAGQLIASRNILVNNHITSGNNLIGAFGLDMDTNGFIYVGYINYNTITDYNANIAKYSTDLIRLWNYNFNPPSIEEGVQIKIGAGGNVFGLIKSTSPGNNIQYHIIKADSNIVSATAFYSFDINLEYVSDFLVDEFNEIYATGYKIISNAKNALTIGIKQSGNLKWRRTYNGGTIIRDDSGNKIVRGTGNELFIVGSSDRGAPNLNDAMVLKYYRTNGRFSFVTFLDNALNPDFGIHIHVYDIYNLYISSISGFSEVIVDRVDTRAGVHTGRKIYAPIPVTPHSSVQSVSISEMKVSPATNVYLTGTVRATDLNGQTFSAYYLANFVPATSRVPLDSAFKIDIVEPVEGDFQTSFTSIGMSIDFASNNLYLLLDRFQTFSSHANEQVRLIGYNSASVVKNENPSILASGNPFNQSLSVFPNPATDFINVKAYEQITRLEISDVTGKTVKSFSPGLNESIVLDIVDLKSGVYILTAFNSKGTSQSIKLIK